MDSTLLAHNSHIASHSSIKIFVSFPSQDNRELPFTRYLWASFSSQDICELPFTRYFWASLHKMSVSFPSLDIFELPFTRFLWASLHKYLWASIHKIFVSFPSQDICELLFTRYLLASLHKIFVSSPSQDICEPPNTRYLWASLHILRHCYSLWRRFCNVTVLVRWTVSDISRIQQCWSEYPTCSSCLVSRRLQRDFVYLFWPISPSYTSPNAGIGRVAGSQPMSTAICTSHDMEPK